MASARHFFTSGTLSDEQLQSDIKDDISTARGAQREMKYAGQYKLAHRMGDAVDEHLDELNDAKRGSWRPRFGK
ncbi:hypothetical protein ABZ769_31985 [Streptomyces olivoreticuli]